MELQVIERYQSLTSSLGICEGLSLRENSSSSEYVAEKVTSVFNKKVNIKKKLVGGLKIPGGFVMHETVKSSFLRFLPLHVA